MLIEFKIQLDNNGGVSILPAIASPLPGVPLQKQLAAHIPQPANPGAQPPQAANPGAQPPQAADAGAQKAANALPAADANAQKGAGAPTDGTGTGGPSGSGMVFVIGPIVICGSGPGHTGPGGGAPTDGPGTGKQAAPDQKAEAAKGV
jgi:hypothetical protein